MGEGFFHDKAIPMKIAIVGEAWGRDEEAQRAPFVGISGYHLTKMLDDAGIHRADCFLTNTFNLHPPGNKLEHFCGPKETRLAGWPSLIKGKYVREEFRPELDRLSDELCEVNPNLIIACGNTPLWALTGSTGISKVRGTVMESTRCVAGFKLLPVYHPAAVMRDWALRPVTVLDLHKARAESAFPEIRRPAREIWIEPTLEDLDVFYTRYIEPCKRLSVDIETAGNAITCLGFATSPALALVVPFVDNRRAYRSYWPSLSDELCAWRFVRRALSHPCGKIMQNGLYDISFLWRSYKLRVRNPLHDTLLLHHALQPESPKSLAFLGSVYTNESSWKLMRPRGKGTIKGDDE
jgi:uracil-DNA glycosylase